MTRTASTPSSDSTHSIASGESCLHGFMLLDRTEADIDGLGELHSEAFSLFLSFLTRRLSLPQQTAPPSLRPVLLPDPAPPRGPGRLHHEQRGGQSQFQPLLDRHASPPQVSDSAHTKLLSGHFPEEGEEGAGRPKRKSGSLTELAHPRYLLLQSDSVTALPPSLPLKKQRPESRLAPVICHGEKRQQSS